MTMPLAVTILLYWGPLKEHARYKYQYEKDRDVIVYLYHEAHYREQLTELKERRKEAKRECATINRCISESTFAHMEIPLDVDVENLYMVDVPEFEGSEISYEESKIYGEATEYGTAETDEDIEFYDEVVISKADLPEIDEEMYEVDAAVSEPVMAGVLQEETDVILQEEFYDGISEPEVVGPSYESVNESMEAVVEGDVNLQKLESPNMTKERYESLTDKEKVEWLGIAECSVQEAIQRFTSKLDSIGVVYRYSDDMLDEFMRLESVVVQMGQLHNNGRRKDDADKKRSR